MSSNVALAMLLQHNETRVWEIYFLHVSYICTYVKQDKNL